MILTGVGTESGSMTSPHLRPRYPSGEFRRQLGVRLEDTFFQLILDREGWIVWATPFAQKVLCHCFGTNQMPPRLVAEHNPSTLDTSPLLVWLKELVEHFPNRLPSIRQFYLTVGEMGRLCLNVHGSKLQLFDGEPLLCVDGWDISLYIRFVEDTESVQQFLRHVDHYAPIGIFVCNREGQLKHINPYLCELLELSWPQAQQFSMEEILVPQWPKVVHELETQSPVTLENRILLRNGTERWLQLILSSFEIPGRSGERFINGIVTDTSAWHRAHRELEQATLLQQNILTTLPLGVVLLDPDKRILISNPRLQEWFPEIEAGKSCCDTICRFLNSDSPTFREATSSCLAEDLIAGAENECELSLLGPENTPVPIFKIRRIPIVQKGEEGCSQILLLFEEISQQRQLEQQLFELQKLSILQAFTRGMTHELSQPLGAIQLTSEVIKRKLEKLKHLEEIEEIRTRFQWIIDAGEEIYHITTRLRQILGTKEEVPRPQEIRELLAESLKMFNAQLIAHRIEFYCELPVQSVKINVCANDFHRVVSALVANVIDAFPPEIEAPRKLKIDSRTMNSDYVILTFADTGEGICPSSQEHLFEPFFTTKNTHVHLGLGLTMVHALVTSWGGRVEIRPNQPRGTVVSIILPIWNDEPASDHSSRHLQVDNAMGGT
ncbi:MAG: PAS domain-containing protein [Lentisphaerae bacterium]|nr:MAG: PAS domain-containing protein [Lentisphaerota bacterium]